MLLACSPRRGGNCDTAAAILREAGGGPPPTALRDYAVSHCTSCGFCAVHPGSCPLRAGDDSEPLFTMLREAPRLTLVAPIYFYHLPSLLKTLIDRSQPWWHAHARRPNGADAERARRKAFPVLIGARPSGERLFTGSLLTLRYWLALFGYELAPPLLLYGLDGPDELAQRAECREAVARYARETISGD